MSVRDKSIASYNRVSSVDIQTHPQVDTAHSGQSTNSYRKQRNTYSFIPLRDTIEQSGNLLGYDSVI